MIRRYYISNGRPSHASADFTVPLKQYRVNDVQ
jgi:hypothetical protein